MRFRTTSLHVIATTLLMGATSVLFVAKAHSAVLDVIKIPHRPTVTDEGDVKQVGSIAFYFRVFGPDRTYELTTSKADAAYPVGTELQLPARSTLRAGSVKVQLAATTESMTMISMASGSKLDGRQPAPNQLLEFWGARKANAIVSIRGVSNITIKNSIFHQTKNNYSSGDDQRVHLIVVAALGVLKPGDITITGNQLRRAGADPKVYPCTWQGQGSGIYATDVDGLTITNNDIAQTLTAGIHFTGSINVNIIGNVIHETGQNAAPGSCGPSEDGITDYHNGLGYQYSYVTIAGNTIYNYGNHGIHVSGRSFVIQNNSIYNGNLHAVFITDQKSPHDCSSNVQIRDNYLKWGSVGGNEPLLVQYSKAGTIAVSGNTGDPINYDWFDDSTACT